MSHPHHHHPHPARAADITPGWSLLRLAAGQRLAIVLALLALLWLATLAVIL
jgi:hypothetical protein